MTVAELIERLRAMPADALVTLCADEWQEAWLIDSVELRNADDAVRWHVMLDANGSQAIEKLKHGWGGV